MTVSVGTYTALSLQRARICRRQLSQARRRWAGASLQQVLRSQCVMPREQLSHQLLPARMRCGEEEREEGAEAPRRLGEASELRGGRSPTSIDTEMDEWMDGYMDGWMDR